MKGKKVFSVMLLGAASLGVLSSCAGSGAGSGGEVTGVGSGSWSEPTPYGMVRVDRGSIQAGPSKADSLRGIAADSRGISV